MLAFIPSRDGSKPTGLARTNAAAAISNIFDGTYGLLGLPGNDASHLSEIAVVDLPNVVPENHNDLVPILVGPNDPVLFLHVSVRFGTCAHRNMEKQLDGITPLAV